MRMPVAAVVAMLLVVGATPSWLFAQNAAFAVRGNNAFMGGGGLGGFPYGGFGGMGGGYGWGMPGTAQSASEYGMASMIAASGYANLQNSMAAQNYTAARSQDINNRVQWTNSYYQMRQAHRAYIADHTRLSMDEITKIAQDAAPKRMDAEQLDPHTGRVNWPIILQDAKYIDITDELDNLYKARATSSGFIGAESYRDINKATEKLMQSLKVNIDEYNANDYEKARHFIENLRYEAKFPTS
ncbi:MAG TPA: hypothetical protein VGG64_03835 [Pirellulales bacterium]